VTAAVGITAAGVSAVAGTVDVPGWIQFLGGAAITGVATFAVRAVEHRTQREKARDLWAALGFALAIPLGAVAYHAWFDPATTGPVSYELVANGSDVQIIRPVGEPGSTNYFVFPPVVGGSHVDVDCHLIVAGRGWYHLTRDHSFLPADALHPVTGTATPDIPTCPS
jgi:hypothetical protein